MRARKFGYRRDALTVEPKQALEKFAFIHG